MLDTWIENTTTLKSLNRAMSERFARVYGNNNEEKKILGTNILLLQKQATTILSVGTCYGIIRISW